MPYKDPSHKLLWQEANRAKKLVLSSLYGQFSPRSAETAKYKVKHNETRHKWRERKVSDWPFVGVDGEGGGKDDLGRQNYLLLRAGADLLFDNNSPLSTVDCLDFLSNLPSNHIYVAYYFDYDVTMILKDTDQKTRDRILMRKEFAEKYGYTEAKRRATYIGDYEVEYIPRKYFRVRRANSKQEWITINDVGGFFQCKFTKAISDWNIGTQEERDIIEAGKLARKDFEIMTEKEIEYNRRECEMLADMMEQFRTVCIETNYIPSRWQGPGWLATRMMSSHKLPKRKELDLSDNLLSFANSAYYGGRFELFKVGKVQNVHEYDINSAYPTAMAFLPCLKHGTWKHGQGNPSGGAPNLYCARIRFSHNDYVICNLPIRDKKTGSIYWPIEGNGTYWSWELEAACNAGTHVEEWREHWSYYKECDCKPFDFVEAVYAKRKEIGKGTKGFTLKLAINSLYGKTAQSIGSAPYANPIWAGLITAYCRRQLISAYSTCNPNSIVMVATDGLYTTDPASVPLGDWLGQWEHKIAEEMFFVQPGIYFSSNSKKPKTRGLPQAVVIEHEHRFRQAYEEWSKEPLNLLLVPRYYPSVEVPIHAFVGMKLAQARGKPDEAGKWIDTTRNISFDFRTKRHFAVLDTECIHTFARKGGKEVYSEPYSRDIGRWRAEAELFDALAQEQPDYFDFAGT